METLTEISENLAGSSHFGSSFPEPLDFELAFTDLYRETEGWDPCDRELRMLRFQFPTILQPLQPGDVVAGRILYPLVGFSPEAGGLGYYCRSAAVRRLLEECAFAPAKVARIEAMLAFWEHETTTARCRAAYPPEVRTALPSDNWTEERGAAFPLYRLAGTMLDFSTLLDGGLPGLHRHISERVPDPDSAFARSIAGAVDLVGAACEFYAEQADAMASDASPGEAAEIKQMANDLRALVGSTPQTLRQAIQLVWIYSLMSGTWSYGRMDVYLGGFLARDLSQGILDKESATVLLCGFWHLMKDYPNQYNNRVIVGGMGRPNEADADRFALLAIETTRRVRLNQPQLTLRFHTGQNPALYQAGLDAIGEGCTFPLLYNDDVYVPAIMRSYGMSWDEAVHYLPYGCGETMFNHRSLSTPNGVLNMVQVLLETLTEPESPESAFPDLDSLWSAYTARTDFYMAALAAQQALEYRIAGEHAGFLLLSLLTDDCLARGKGITSGGVRRLEGCVETYGNINVSDSLTAIDRLVYREKSVSLGRLVSALRENFAGDESLREMLRTAPKYGNDDDEADAMAIRVHEEICRSASAQTGPSGLDAYRVVIINNWANVVLGEQTGASPDGRPAGEPFANANNPSPGQDRAGVTAFLNSLVKLDPGLHAGAVQNMKFSPGLFNEDRGRLEALLGVYWKNGGSQAMITVVGRGDLEAAMREPEKWGHLMVRVGGFSIRFVDLPPESQREVLARTLN